MGAGYVNYPTPFVALHLPDCLSDRVKVGIEADLHHLLKLGDREVFYLGGELNARVVDQNVFSLIENRLSQNRLFMQ